MRRPTQRWKPARTGGSGAIPVEEVGNENNVGLAKSRGFQYEKLASDLARVVGVTVPPVDIDAVEGKEGLWAVSKAHGETSIDGFMGRVAEKELFNSSAVQVAFRAASGLVAFHAWIRATDQKAEHFCIAAKPDGGYAVAGVDFEMAFQWHGMDGGQILPPSILRLLLPNIDKSVVNTTVIAIETITRAEIEATVASLPEMVVTPSERTRLADGLAGRAMKVRDTMKALGWLE